MDIKKEISDDKTELMDEIDQDIMVVSDVCTTKHEDTVGEVDNFVQTVDFSSTKADLLDFSSTKADLLDFSSTKADLLRNTDSVRSLKILDTFTLTNKEDWKENESIVNVSDKSKGVSMIAECSDIELDQNVDSGSKSGDTVTNNNRKSKVSTDVIDSDVEEGDCIGDDTDTNEQVNNKEIYYGCKTIKATTVICKQCNKTFTSERFLKRHKLQFHPKGPMKAVRDGRYQCEMCHKRFGSQSRLTQPSSTQIGKQQNKCKLCFMKCTVRIQNMTSPACKPNNLSINGNSENLVSPRRLKPGKKKSVKNEEEKIKNEMQAQRMQKSRLIKQLRKVAIKFQNQTYEPVETLFIVYEKNKNLFKYYGSGDIVEKFEKGEALMKDPTRRSKMSANIEPRAINPGKYQFPFTCGSGENSAADQENEVFNISVSLNDSRQLSVNINPGSNRPEQQKGRTIFTNFKKSLTPARFKRLPMNTSGRSKRRVRNEKKTQTESTPVSLDNENFEG